MDLTLIRRCQAGDTEAFASLFETYKNLVFHTAYLILDNRVDAEDVLQEVFVQVYRSLETYDPARGAFTTWLYRITVNRCINFRRRRSFFNHSLEELSESVLQEPGLSESQRADVEICATGIGSFEQETARGDRPASLLGPVLRSNRRNS